MSMRSWGRTLILLGVCAAVGAVSAGGDLGDRGTFPKWGRVEIVLRGPTSTGTGTPNPFAKLVDVTFTAPSGRTWVVPGFYDGNGTGGLNGDVWKVRFSADETGVWTFRSASADSMLDGYTGRFTITTIPANAEGFYRWGRLEYVGTAANRQRYFKFRDGPYWMKAGSDDPENFLGSFTNFDTQAERKAAIDYLAERGVNSQYLITHNVDGDNNDVWPWLGNTTSEAKANGGTDSRFDVARLEEWLDLFEYMQRRGVAVYMILEDDSPWTGFDRDRYYREMVARFGHLPALLFNLGEEASESYSLSVSLGYMADLAAIDPYDHPRGIHNVNRPTAEYIDAPQVNYAAMQTKYTDPLEHNDDAIDWINDSIARGKRVIMPGFDEPRPLMDRKGWWSAYIGGGMWEVHTVQPYDRPMSAFEPAWTEIGGARAFMESLRFWEMDPANSVVTQGQAFCLAKPGEAYALYLPSGGTVAVNLPAGKTYRYDWWNPANGRNGSFQNSGQVAGGSVSFTAPGSGDWALRILAADGQGENAPPIAQDSTATVDAGGSVAITLAYSDPDGPGPYTFVIVQQPTQGTLSGTGAVRTYTANPGASGSDSFRWKVNDGLADSNVATVTISIRSGGNQAPIANDQQEYVDEGASVAIALSYDDADGPGPYTFTIVRQPLHGTVQQEDPGSNDVVYVPAPGYVGPDSFGWKTNDSLVDSNVGDVGITVLPAPDPPAPPGNLRVK